MTTRVKALYDFSGEPNTSEISIAVGEILILKRTDVGEGWWEGTNSQGTTGLFPEAYVEIYKETQPPALAPPINPMLNQTQLPQNSQGTHITLVYFIAPALKSSALIQTASSHM